MTDQEKIMRHDTLEEIRTKIGGCFGTADGIFAGHPSDEKCARYGNLKRIEMHLKCIAFIM